MAIGTSHLVLSTKAGAQYGWIMVVPIILANVLKYPFFEFGVRYTNATRKTLIEGYLRLGKPYLYIYALITLVSMLTILAALYVVTAGLMVNLLALEWSLNWAALVLFILISILLIVGRYRFLENALKIVVSILFVVLLATTFLVLYKGPTTPVPNFSSPELFDEVGILFLIGLVGWMPTAVEAAGWVSMWSVEKLNSMDNPPSVSEALREFKVGYWITGLLAIFFLVIGWLTLYGTNTELSGSAVVFSDQLVTIFTAHIGQWAYFFIAISAFATMFSTCMTAHDAVARVGLDIVQKLYPSSSVIKLKNNFTWLILLLAIANWLVIYLYKADMGKLVTVATFVSFVFAPILGWMNLKAVTSKDIPKAHKPSYGLRFLSYLGMVFLSFFAIYYCYTLRF
ncbi:NRAMP family divalent metal transporter [Flavobacterium sp. ASW18X]|uniref:NRAMP family divalent metal transporter n=1 Tax=Flavobacterium sp. ASW18X TaxID=2572595 RepID=UPI0010ADD6E8|nr:divalent metal cation transporter [Flavobacterium sp. ASW18X]TKD66669.1 divalent metal cation transporter [Flavobacterium sp. ASW18X]